VLLLPGGFNPADLHTGYGPLALGLENRTEDEVLVAVETAWWPDTAATAALLSTMQEFRDLFSAEVLAPNLEISVQRLAFLFTDLTGSTALYQAVGQARAFRLVQDHFVLLGEAVQAKEGAIVKTIGDAVMAVFQTSAAAVGAALEMQHRIRALDTAGAADPARLLKVGVHAGPCVAVSANGRLDYFGTTVNMAARVEHESRGGEVVLTAEVGADPAVAALLAERGITAEPFETRLRGIRDPVPLWRITSPVPAPVL